VFTLTLNVVLSHIDTVCTGIKDLNGRFNWQTAGGKTTSV